MMKQQSALPSPAALQEHRFPLYFILIMRSLSLSFSLFFNLSCNLEHKCEKSRQILVYFSSCESCLKWFSPLYVQLNKPVQVINNIQLDVKEFSQMMLRETRFLCR